MIYWATVTDQRQAPHETPMTSFDILVAPLLYLPTSQNIYKNARALYAHD
jgi:hypothetical protein